MSSPESPTSGRPNLLAMPSAGKKTRSASAMPARWRVPSRSAGGDSHATVSSRASGGRPSGSRADMIPLEAPQQEIEDERREQELHAGDRQRERRNDDAHQMSRIDLREPDRHPHRQRIAG